MARSRGRAGAGLLCALGLAAVLVVTLLARGGFGTTGLELTGRQVALDRGCTTAAEPAEEPPGLLFEGELQAVSELRDGGAVLDFDVVTWFVGPPLEQVDVRTTAADLDVLERDGTLRPGTSLVVRAAAWPPDGRQPVVGCADLLPRSDDLVAELAAAHPPAAVPAPDGPAVLYSSAAWTRTASYGLAVLSGVLLVDHGCLHVDDGVTRWLLRLPSQATEWDEDEQSLRFDDEVLAPGSTVRLAGSPEAGLVPRRGQQLSAAPGSAPPGGRSGGPCPGSGPGFVVAEAPGEAASVSDWPERDGFVRSLVEAGDRSGLTVGGTEATLTQRSLGGASLTVTLAPRTGSAAGDVTLQVDTAPARAWPDAYLDDEAHESALLGPRCEAGADPAAGAVVQQGPQRTRVLLRSPGGVLVTVTGAADLDDEGVCALAALAVTASAAVS